MRILVDDVGSYPPRQPPEFDERLREGEEEAVSLLVELFEEKRSTGLDVPAYPQLCDMIESYSRLLGEPENWEEPYLLREELARKPALEALNRHYGEEGEVVEVKAALTGPVELAIAEAGPKPHRDVLLPLAETVKRFGERATSLENLEVSVVSIDEPSLGTNPNVDISGEDLVEAFRVASDVDAEVQAHLHSPLYYEETLKGGMEVVGIETASDPSRADAVDREVLESHEGYLRAGVSRTDSDAMGAEYRDRTGEDPFDPGGFTELLDRDESPGVVEERLEGLYDEFGDRLRYVGPDCGLGGFPGREAARRLLENTVEGVERFRGSRGVS